MPTECKMTIDERYKYLRIVQPEYLSADRQRKGVLLGDMV